MKVLEKKMMGKINMIRFFISLEKKHPIWHFSLAHAEAGVQKRVSTVSGTESHFSFSQSL